MVLVVPPNRGLLESPVRTRSGLDVLRASVDSIDGVGWRISGLT